MSSARRRKFQTKQNVITVVDSKNADSEDRCFYGEENMGEGISRRCLKQPTRITLTYFITGIKNKFKKPSQSYKSIKINNKFLPTSSKKSIPFEPLYECDSFEKQIDQVDKDITASPSNIDFYYILNLSKSLLKDPNASNKSKTDAKCKRMSRSLPREKYTHPHRAKIRSPKRQPIVDNSTLETNDKMAQCYNDDAFDASWKSLGECIYLAPSQTNENYQQSTSQNDSVVQNDHTPTVVTYNMSSSNNPIFEMTCFKATISANDTVLNNDVISSDATKLENSSTNINEPVKLTDSINANNTSSVSLDEMCRICHGGSELSSELGPMISACGCRGTVGRVHVKCLERWLTESGKSRCELCGTRYSTKRIHKYGVPKALAIWIFRQNAKQLMVDGLGIILMSPLALVAGWLSCSTLAGLISPEMQQTPWPLASTFVLACMTLVCYYCWIVSAVTRHALGWWIWYRSQYEVKLQFQEED